MKRHEEGGWVLTPDEVDGLAMRLTLDQLAAWEPDWSDVPRMAESSWEEVAAAYDECVSNIEELLRLWEEANGVDTSALREELEA